MAHAKTLEGPSVVQNQWPTDLINSLDAESKKDYGYYLLRNNYKRIKPYSKYSLEGTRPVSPNTPYSHLSEDLIKKNQENKESVFRYSKESVVRDSNHQTENVDEFGVKKNRFYVDRSTDTYNQHLIRGESASQPYCYITKDKFNHNPKAEYSSSDYGAYPTWGVDQAGHRTRSHYVEEPVERYVNIDMYRRPPTNQPGRIIFDYGRPNNGYYLQRNQYDNTWFNSNLKLNQTDILRDIEPKTESEYKRQGELNRTLVRSKTMEWPFASEYTERFALKTQNNV